MKGAELTEADIAIHRINNILYRKYEAGWKYRFESRPSCALYYILSGEARITLPEGEFLVGAGTVCAFDADIPLSLENPGPSPLESYQISFYADKNLSALGLFPVIGNATDLRPRFAAAYEGYSGRGECYRIRARAALLELIAALIAALSEERGSKRGARIAPVLDYIKENYTAHLSLPMLSRAVGYSPSYLRELFRAELGLSPVHYVNRLRIERACSLLHEDIPIWQVAELVGCPNANYFSRLFRAEMGVTPGEYKGRCL